MSLLFKFIKTIFLWGTSSTYHRFVRKIPEHKLFQIDLLRKIHRLSQSLTEDECLDYHRQKPIKDYDQLGSEYHLAQKNTPHPFTQELIKFVEPTSGSSGRKKRILYTQSLLKIFQKMFMVWSSDILINQTRLKTGVTYISISPRFAKEDDEGLESDRDYLPSIQSFLLSPFMLCPAKVGRIQSNEEYFLVTACYFCSDQNLEIISVWSPSFLVSIIKYIVNNPDAIKNTLAKQSYKTNCGLKFSFRRMSSSRLDLIHPNQLHRLFEHVKFISCWVTSSGKSDIHFLKDFFPEALFQPKGLLATEAPLTIPLFKEFHQIPLYDSIFYELIDQEGEIYYLWNCLEDQIYELVFTHAGGLVRYRLGDLVKVKGIYKHIPIFEFVSRTGAISDMVGEKLTETFLNELNATNHFHFDWVIIPDKTIPHQKGYLLFFDESSEKNIDEVMRLVKLIEASYHFHHALKLKQLNPITLNKVENLKEKIMLYYEKKGLKRGDIKFAHLIYRDNDLDLIDVLKSR